MKCKHKNITIIQKHKYYISDGIDKIEETGEYLDDYHIDTEDKSTFCEDCKKYLDNK